MAVAEQTARVAGGVVGGVHGISIFAFAIGGMVLANCTAEGRSAFLHGRTRETEEPAILRSPVREPRVPEKPISLQKEPVKEQANKDGQEMLSTKPSKFIPIDRINIQQFMKVRIQVTCLSQ